MTKIIPKIKSRTTGKSSRQKVLNFLKEAGIPLSKERTKIQWDGQKLWSGNNCSNLLHDLAHWQLCAADRRSKPDYGLGSGPESIGGVPRLVSMGAANKEECRASVLGIVYEYCLGMASGKTFKEHSWNDTYNGPKFETILKKLVEDSFLTADYKPTMKMAL